MLKKKGDVSKSTARPKSARMPLRNISNSNNGARVLSNKTSKKLPEKKEQGDSGDNELDRLLLVHSDLSSLVRQVDELVVQALASRKEINEIKAFADVLSEMHASLKPWAQKFEKALSDPSARVENAAAEPLASTAIPVVEDNVKRNVVDSPEQCKWDSLVCSSPLVLWPAEHASECNRQLFLLTPLHQSKGLQSKFRERSRPDQIPQMPSVFDVMLDMDDSFLDCSQPETAFAENVDNKKQENIAEPTIPAEVSDITMNGLVVVSLESKLASPEKGLSKENSFVLMTPCLKTSPPKSCIVLEPVSEYRFKGGLKFHKSTPYPIALQSSSESEDSESSTGQSDDLNLKYPELFGIKLGKQNDNRWKVAEESPKWSPPKTCVLLEPPEDGSGECLNPQTAPKPIQNNLPSKGNNTQALGSSKYELVESTPAMKEPESCVKMGKHPGENTLKRELWTKFEAASTSSILFNPPAIQKTLGKGFLDMLDEVSSDE